MAIGVIKLTKNGRQMFALVFTIMNCIQILLGFTVTGSSVYICIVVAPILSTEKAEINFVFAVTGIYGTHVIFHWLLGIGMACKCHKEAYKKSTRSLLLLWMCFGTNTLVNLLIVAGISKKINKHILRTIRQSFEHGMQNYLSDKMWKTTIDQIQYAQECCGLNSYEDWHETKWLTKYHINEDSDTAKQFINRNSSNLPVTPWSCCRVDFPMQCLHDPLQQKESIHVWADSPSVVTDSLNTKGCLDLIRKPITTVLVGFIIITSMIAVFHILIIIVARILYTSCRNAILLNDLEGIAPGWIFGRGDCGYSRGKTLSEIMALSHSIVPREESEELIVKSEKSKVKLFGSLRNKEVKRRSKENVEGVNTTGEDDPVTLKEELLQLQQ